MSQEKDEAAEVLIRSNFEVSDYLQKVVRFLAEDEDGEREPIKLIEIDDSAIEVGRVDVFGFAGGGDVPFGTAIGIVTPAEWARVERGELALPEGWESYRRVEYDREKMLGVSQS